MGVEMAKLIYSAITSLDGYVADDEGRFDWAGARTRIERDLAPDALRRLKEISKADITIGGAELAGQAIALGQVDECQLFLEPIVVGGGKRALPGNIRAQLELLDERRFRSGVVHLRYGVSV
jgi:hypothetical protein